MPARQIPREKGPLAKKIADTEGALFFAFSKLARGHGGRSICRFPDRRAISRFCFFHAAQAPLRVSQNDSSGQAVFLGQLVEEGTT
jgi:hypothetical protein